MLEVGPGFIQRALFDLHVRLGLMKGRHCLIDVSLRRSVLREQFLCPSRIYFCELKRGLGVRQISLRLGDSGLKKRWIDLGHDLACFYLRIKIGEQLRDVPRDLAAHLYVDDGIERARGGYCLCNRASRDGGNLIIASAAVAALPHHGSDNEQPNDQSDPRDKTFHLHGS